VTRRQAADSGGWFAERAGLAGTVGAVVGGAGGLGLAISRDLAANGVRLAVLDRDPDSVDALHKELSGGEHTVLLGDAREPEALDELFAAADGLSPEGRLDTLVNVVGGTFKAPFTETRPRGWDALLRVNLQPVLHACASAVPRMRAGGRGGSIVNITTIEAHRAAPGYSVYAAAKAAVTHFARNLAVELGPDGIRVNNVAPDYAPTPNLSRLAAGASPLETPEGIRAAVPLARAGTPADVAGCVVFLASGLSAYVTGTTLHVDGGTLASSGWLNSPDEGWINHLPADQG
jgi:NAD(P)-dependent dehydrogenase (short-subunit alcohol dehydrogenase family)